MTHISEREIKTILVLDDCESDLKIFEEVIGNLDCQALITTSFKQAYDACLNRHIDIIISDLNVGDDSGFNLMDAAHNLPNGKDIMKIICTSESPAENLKDIKKYNIVGWIVKPVEHNSISKVLKKLVAY